MKKTLILASLLAFSMTTVIAAEETTTPQTPTKTEIQTVKPQVCPQKPIKKQDCKKAEFEKRLKLTDKQKAQAEQLRMKGHEEMKPIMEKIKAKHQEAEVVRRSRISVEMQKEKLDKIHQELKELHKQAHELRMKNMQEFESILTKRQKKELEKMKQEGRKRFEQRHKRPPMGIKPEFGPHGHGPQLPPTQPKVEK